MFRQLLVILIIANLLLCPLACTGVLRCAEDDVAAGKPTCSCGMCERSREAPRDQLPPAEQPCDSCQCLCGGAVCLKDSGPELVVATGHWAAVVEIDEPPASVFGICSRSERASHPPGPHSGRMLRLELESLLC